MLEKVDILYLVPTCVSWHKQNTVLHTFEERYNTLKTRIYLDVIQKPKYKKIVVSDIERGKEDNDWGFVDTLKVIKKRYPKQEIISAFGADSFNTIKLWKDWEEIVANTKLVVYNRPGYTVRKDMGIDYEFVDINFDCSSSKDREAIRGMTDEEFEELLDEDWWNVPLE